MEATNSLTKQEKKQEQSFGEYLQLPSVQQSLSRIFSDTAELTKFTASLAASISTNPSLAKCTHSSLVVAGLTAHSLKLTLSPQLGFCYAIPYEQKEKRDKYGNVTQRAGVIAQFQMGYRGYLQLAIRSGYYEDIDVIEIRQGEYLGRDSLTGKHRFQFISDEDKRESLPIVGYMAYFVQLNGFKKVVYWTKEKMLKHADRYSPAFSLNGNDKKVSYSDFLAGNYPEKDVWKYSSYWYTSFNDMAFKTVIKQLITKWGIMSIDMQDAFKNDSIDGTNDDNNTSWGTSSTTSLADDYSTVENIYITSGSHRVDTLIQSENGVSEAVPTEKDKEMSADTVTEEQFDFFG